MGLVFSDDDWKHFLSTPSVSDQTSGHSHLPHDLFFDFGGTTTLASTTKESEKPKETPLSPPSIQGNSNSPKKIESSK